MNLILEVENASGCDDVPDDPEVRSWVSAALSHPQIDLQRTAVELSVRIVDSAESQTLNQRYRGRDKPTNVLSFPANLPPELELPLLGDLVICAPLVVKEAQQQHKAPQAHWAHMLVHGTLHLLGYDHIDENEAETMEALETDIMTGLGFAPPYEAANTFLPDGANETS